MKTKLNYLLMASMLVAATITGCKKDTPLPDVNEEELITTVRLKFTNGTDVRTFTARDLDGDGGNAPVIQNITLAANTTYTLEVDAILNETETPAEDIKAEVAEEADEHLIVYTPTGNLTVTVTDRDTNNLPIGLAGRAVTTAAGAGNLKVVLRHQPDGAKNGTAAPGSTDFDFTFPVIIQ